MDERVIDSPSVRGHGHRGFWRELRAKAKQDQITMGAAAVAFYSMLALFPMAIFVLTLLPYLPIANLEQSVLDLVRQVMPGDAANVFTGTVNDVIHGRKGGLLSVGFILTLWTASAGMYALIRRLNVANEVEETRPYWKVRALALGLTLACVVLVVGALALAVFGGALQGWAANVLGWSQALLIAFAALRWVVIAVAVMLALALTYRFGPDVRRRFEFFTFGTAAGTLALAAATAGFKVYVANFANYNKVYGGLGAVVVLMMWLYFLGLATLVGAEVDVAARRRRSDPTRGWALRDTVPMSVPGAR